MRSEVHSTLRLLRRPKRKCPVTNNLNHVLCVHSTRLLRVTRPIREKIRTMKKIDGHRLDVLAAVSAVETVLHGSETFSFSRLMVVGMGLQICLNPNIISRESDVDQV